MIVKEELNWILDQKGKSYGEKEYQLNIVRFQPVPF